MSSFCRRFPEQNWALTPDCDSQTPLWLWGCAFHARRVGLTRLSVLHFASAAVGFVGFFFFPLLKKLINRNGNKMKWQSF